MSRMQTSAFPNDALPTRWVTRTPASPALPAGPFAAYPDGAPGLASGLKLVGMAQRQARLYLAVSREPQTARNAANEARFHRATAYRLIVRLLERGLIVGDGGSPQRFRAAPPEMLLTRLEGFLREEADLCSALTRAYLRPGLGFPLAHPGSGPNEPPRILAIRGGAHDPALAEIDATRQTLDLVLRPVGCSIAFRSGLLRTLGNLLRRGVRIRLLTDATPADQRFIAALSRERGDQARLLQRRHVAPVGAHYYICDGRIAIRLPALSLAGQVSAIALAERDPDRVQAQVERFRVLWDQSSEPFGPVRSTRAYAWSQAATGFRSGSEGAASRADSFPVVHFTPGLAGSPLADSSESQS
jgi:hypothetical protein